MLTTSIGISGPPVALWLARLGLAPSQMRDSLGAVFLGLSLLGALALVPVVAHEPDVVSLDAIGAGAVCVVAGHAIGSRAFVRIEAHRYEPLLMSVVLAGGVASVIAGLF